MRYPSLYPHRFFKDCLPSPKSILVLAPGVKVALNTPPPRFWYRLWMRLFFGWVWEDPSKSGFN